ncbi:MAG: hypothetical protein JWM59_5051 [Verrucomicrobiales bacterium]|nr:hypothetical protein [Verrucomicrobiales bacterium]
MKKAKSARKRPVSAYPGLVGGIGDLIQSSRHAAARTVNSLMTATYWEVGRRIVEFEQGGDKRASYGDELLTRLAGDLTARFGRGFSRFNLGRFRQFYLAFPPERIRATLSLKSAVLEKRATVSNGLPSALALADATLAFPLSWSHYVRLLQARSPEALEFYGTEALRGGWSVRQLDRQMSTLFYERTALSKNKTALLGKGPGAAEELTADEAIRDPLVLEFLNLRDEYSESDLEDALIRRLETFLLELGGDFAFVGRQRRLRIDDEWYRVDLVFFHRRLRCLVIVDLKLGKFTHADAGQMHLYLSYAAEHWTHPGENPPVGLILCSSVGSSLVRYTLDTLPSKVLAREYKLALPDERQLAREIEAARAAIQPAGKNPSA